MGSANGAAGSTPSLLYYNYGIRVADNNTLYIADQYNHRVLVVPSNSTNASIIIGNGYGTSINQMNYPTDVFVTNNGIYVLDSYNYRVVYWNKNGTNPTLVAGSTGVAGGSTSYNTFNRGYQIFVDIYGNLYLSDQANHRVLRFAPNSKNGTNATVVAGTGSSGDGPDVLNSPWGIFVDTDLTLYIADTGNHRIQRWKYYACNAVTVAGRVTISGSGLYQLNNPTAVAVDSNQYLYIVDKGNNRLLRWAPEACMGVCLAGCTTGAGTSSTQLSTPFSIAFDSQGSIYVSDTNNHRVQKFQVSNNQGKNAFSNCRRRNPT